MDTKTYTTVVHDFFRSWLKTIATRIFKGDILIPGPYSYPTMLRVGISPSHFIAELLGSTGFISFQKPYKLELIKPLERFPNTALFFNPGFDSPPSENATLHIPDQAQDSSVMNIAFCTEYDEKTFTKKVNFHLAPVKFIPPGVKIPLSMAETANYILFRNVDLIRTDTFRILFRTISTAFVVRKSENASSLSNWLTRIAQDRINFDILGLNIGYNASSESFARELASLSDQNVSEPIIDKFIQTHAHLFAKALGYRRALSQLELQWIDRKADDPKISKPDYLLEREDGFFDILDLKKALLKYKSITTGKKARIRFNAYVSELAAQLIGYKRYFYSSKNRKWANDKYGISVSDPQLIGIVGNYDSFQRENVDLALEQYKDSITIFSYHELINLLRKR